MNNDEPTLTQRKGADEDSDTELLDEEGIPFWILSTTSIIEQEQIIKNMESQNRNSERRYRAVFCAVGIVMFLIFAWFAYLFEEYGGIAEMTISKHASSVILLLTAFGFVAQSYRVMYAKREQADASNDGKTLLALIVAIVIAIIQAVFWYGPYLNAQQQQGNIFKYPFLVLPLLLPVYTICSEYALSIFVSSRNDVNQLHQFKYKYKKIWIMLLFLFGFGFGSCGIHICNGLFQFCHFALQVTQFVIGHLH